MGATNFSSDLGDEDRAVCGSPRGEGSLSAFHRGGDDDYADREFDFDDLLLSWCSAKTRWALCIASVVRFRAASLPSRCS
jgi:hypothetical protein